MMPCVWSLDGGKYTCALPSQIHQKSSSSKSESAKPIVKESVPTVEIEVNDTVPAITTLQRYFSIQSVLSTASSLAIEKQEAVDAAQDFCLEDIGSGMCGAVFSIRDTGNVVKRATGATFFARQIKQDFEGHTKVYDSHYCVEDVLVPMPIEFVDAAGYLDWQLRHNALFQDCGWRYREPASILISERILPLPKLVRDSLIDLFCPQALREAAKDDWKNKSCLARLYLGIRRTMIRTADSFSLRNFELTLDRMAEIGIDPTPFAKRMGSSLATVHWGAQIDGRDIEYVLGSASSSVTAQKNCTPCLSRRTVDVWLLDFNQCEPITVDETGIKQCVKAFWDNDPYYPRPDTDSGLWEVFSSAYKIRGNEILPNSPFPESFIDRIERLASLRMTSGPPPRRPPGRQ